MRDHANSEGLNRSKIDSGNSEVGDARRTIEAQVDRLVKKIADSVSLNSLLWRDPLRVLLMHPRPPLGLSEVHRCLRAASRRTRYDEQVVDHISKAVAAAKRAHGLADLLAPVRVVLAAFAGVISSRPHVSMLAVRQIIETAGLAPPLSLSFETCADRSLAPAISRKDAMLTVEKVVQSAVNVLLREQALGQTAFASWEKADILAGMEALWLAYTYCKLGSANASELSSQELRADWERCGAPLWRQLDKACRLAHLVTSGEPYVDKTPEFVRLGLALKSTVPSMVASDWAVVAPSIDSLTHIVCRAAIPYSSDKHDTEEIARHRVLEAPLPVVPMPPLQFIESSRAALLAEFPWAATAVEVIFGDLLGRANLGVRDLTLPATLLVGLPGAGKSRLARRIAEVLDLARLDVSLAGTSDTKIIGGTSRGWASGRPSDLASLLARRRTASALVLLDEIDKASDHHREGGGICAYLLALLEPETASRHYDSYLKTECDFSKVSWLCTANTLSGITKPLQSRLRILAVPQPQARHFPAVSRGVIAELETRWQLPTGSLPSADKLGIDWTRLTSARQVRIAMETSIGHWARSMVKH